MTTLRLPSFSLKIATSMTSPTLIGRSKSRIRPDTKLLIMAPVTPHSAEIQQDKAPLLLRLREHGVRPRLPIDVVLFLLAKRDVQKEQQEESSGAQVHNYTPNFVFSLRRSIC